MMFTLIGLFALAVSVVCVLWASLLIVVDEWKWASILTILCFIMLGIGCECLL